MELSASERLQFEKMKKMVPGASIEDIHTAPNGMKFMSTPIKQDWEYISQKDASIKVRTATELKNSGSESFRAALEKAKQIKDDKHADPKGDERYLLQASDQYEAALQELKSFNPADIKADADEPQHILSKDEIRSNRSALMISCNLNAAVVYTKLGKWGYVVGRAAAALEELQGAQKEEGASEAPGPDKAQVVKALFYRAKGYSNTNRPNKAKADLKRALELDSKNKPVRQEMKRVLAQVEELRARQKRQDELAQTLEQERVREKIEKEVGEAKVKADIKRKVEELKKKQKEEQAEKAKQKATNASAPRIWKRAGSRGEPVPVVVTSEEDVDTRSTIDEMHLEVQGGILREIFEPAADSHSGAGAASVFGGDGHIASRLLAHGEGEEKKAEVSASADPKFPLRHLLHQHMHYDEVSYSALASALMKIRHWYGAGTSTGSQVAAEVKISERMAAGAAGKKGACMQNHSGAGGGYEGKFVDLGSGVGVALFTALLVHDFKQVIGLEGDKILHDAALEVKKRWASLSGVYQSKAPTDVSLHHCDIAADAALGLWADADVVFFNNVSGSNASSTRAGQRLEQRELMRTVARGAARLRPGAFVITTGQPLPSVHFELIDVATIPTYWGTDCPPPGNEKSAGSSKRRYQAQSHLKIFIQRRRWPLQVQAFSAGDSGAEAMAQGLVRFPFDHAFPAAGACLCKSLQSLSLEAGGGEEQKAAAMKLRQELEEMCSATVCDADGNRPMSVAEEAALKTRVFERYAALCAGYQSDVEVKGAEHVLAFLQDAFVPTPEELAAAAAADADGDTAVDADAEEALAQQEDVEELDFSTATAVSAAPPTAPPSKKLDRKLDPAPPPQRLAGVAAAVTVLDAGCGAGALAAWLESQPLAPRTGKGAVIHAPELRVVGVDMCAHMVVFAAANFAGIDFHQMELSQLHVGSKGKVQYGFPKQSFDAVVCNDVWQDLVPGERFHVLLQFWQVLKPSGRLYLTVPVAVDPDRDGEYSMFSTHFAAPAASEGEDEGSDTTDKGIVAIGRLLLEAGFALLDSQFEQTEKDSGASIAGAWRLHLLKIEETALS